MIHVGRKLFHFVGIPAFGMVQHLRFDRVVLSKNLILQLKNDETFILSCPSPASFEVRLFDFCCAGDHSWNWCQHWFQLWGMYSTKPLYFLNKLTMMLLNNGTYVFFVNFLCCGCDPEFFGGVKTLLVFGFLFPEESKFTISNTSCVGIFVTSPGLCNLTSNLSPLHRPPPPLPTSPIARWLGEFFRDSAGAGVWNEGSHSYLHLLQIQYLPVLTTVKCEHVRIIVHYDTSHFHFMHVYPVYSCLMYCWFIASEYLQLLVSIVSTYWFIHTISTYIHHLGIFPPLSTPSQCAHFEKFTHLKTNIFPPKGTIESKKSPTGPTERTPKPQYLIALATSLGVRW